MMCACQCYISFHVVLSPYISHLYVLQSHIREHGGMMIVASKQYVGTLVGVQHGLFIISIGSDDNQLLVDGKLILSHCAVTSTLRTTHSTADVSLQLQSLHTPSFYVYDVDTRLRAIRGPNDLQALLYLAQLFATTASARPDVLTGITGTESALKLLQSGRCSQSQPLSTAAITA
jgi:hypothetical protein